jgi:hypothetical protein
LKPARWHLFVWIVRLVKVLVAGLTTCGLAWVWIAFYLYDERFRRRPRGAMHPPEGDG